MLKVMIVDDERIIREGLANDIDWQKLGMKVIALAEDGKHAYELILEHNPHIVITDIRMPEMDGIELIKRTREFNQNIVFVILSGYNDFSYAQEAMFYGASAYHLKPIDDDEISNNLLRIRIDIEKEIKRKELENQIHAQMKKQLPIIKEKFIRDFITNSYFEHEEFEYYKNYFDIENKNVRIILYQLDNENNLEELFSLKNLIEIKVSEEDIFVCCSLRNHVLLILNNEKTDDEVITLISNINNFFHEFYDSNLQAVYSKSETLMGLPYIYRQASKCLKFSFYLNGEFILNIDDLLSDKSLKDEEPNFDTEDIGGYIISGNLEKTLESIEKYFENLQKIKLPVNITKTYLTELYITIIRQAPNKGLDSYVKNMIKFSTSNSIEEIKQEIVKTASDITKNNFIEISSKQSDIIKRALAYIDENLHDEHLSLKLICKDVVFISIDYFGKLFKKEVGENFPQYVMRKRIEASIDMIADSSVEKIYEIADKVGFGDNAQYFSQVFKKVLGITPTQYKEKYFTK